MLKEFFKKELREQLMSLRLVLCFLLVMLLMALGAILFQSEYQQLLSDYHR